MISTFCFVVCLTGFSELLYMIDRSATCIHINSFQYYSFECLKVHLKPVLLYYRYSCLVDRFLTSKYSLSRTELIVSASSDRHGQIF
jgi:hypothetical protein